MAAQVAGHIAKGFSREFALDFLFAPEPGTTVGLGSALRLNARGGASDKLPPQSGEDKVKVGLRRLAVDAFPVFLGTDDANWTSPPYLSLIIHPAHDEVSSAIEQDPQLRRLFVSEDELGKSGFGDPFRSLDRLAR